MKKLIFMMSVLCLSSSVLAKVTYEDAVKSSESFYQHNNAVNIKPNNVPLGPGEWQTDTASTDNAMGHWGVVSNSSVSQTNSGEYTMILAPHSQGKQCVKGSKGLIMLMQTRRICNHWNSKHTHCEGYIVKSSISDSGLRAECK